MVIHTVEAHLVSMNLNSTLQRILQEDVAKSRPPQLASDMHFYGPDATALPPGLSALEDGFTELEHPDSAQFAYRMTVNGRVFLLVQDQTSFEQREEVLYSVVLAGFLLSVMLAWGLGWLLARRVIAPIIALAGQVQQPEQALIAAPALADGQPDDEIGQLARAFDATLGRLRNSLEREQLFTSDVSHELRTPLTVIASACELLLAADALSPRQRHQLERIHRASGELSDLVQVFLTLARAAPLAEGAHGHTTLAALAEEQQGFWAAPMADKGWRSRWSGRRPTAAGATTACCCAR